MSVRKEPRLPVGMFDNKPVIDIFECVTCDLLLCAASSTIFVFHWIQMFV